MKEPSTLILGIVLAIFSAAICMQIMGQLGTAPNTSLIGAVLVMIVARLPLAFTQTYRDIHRQNNILSLASSAGFTAANGSFVAIATVFILGRNDLIISIAIGTLMGSLISVFAIGMLFDSKIFPADGSWPTSQAIATTLTAGDAGGKKGWELVQGLTVGAICSFLGIPAAGIGLAFVANMLTMTALGLGTIFRGHSTLLFNGFDIAQSNIPQGIMIGAGLVAFIQIIHGLSKRTQTTARAYLVGDTQVKQVLGGAVGLFMLGAVILSALTGLWGNMGLGMYVLWVAFSGLTALVVMLLVGTASMHTGIAPAFAVVTICLTAGLLIGFPPMALAVLVGYIGAVGMPLADTGIGLKAGWLLRGSGAQPDLEQKGRRDQIFLKLVGVVIGVAMAIIFGSTLADTGVIPPMSFFYANAIGEPVSTRLIVDLALWAIPGAILQGVFGSKSVGLMFATGLLINNPLFGMVVIASVIVRRFMGTTHMQIRGPGLIAGDGVFGFISSVLRAF